MNRESIEGWPLLTVESEVNGDSKRTNQKGHFLVGSLDSSCRYNAGDEAGGVWLSYRPAKLHRLAGRNQWFWRPDVWHKNFEGRWYSKNLFIKNRFPKYWVVAPFWTIKFTESAHWSYYEMKTFFLWLGRMGYQKILFFILISKMYIWP